VFAILSRENPLLMAFLAELARFDNSQNVKMTHPRFSDETFTFSELRKRENDIIPTAGWPSSLDYQKLQGSRTMGDIRSGDFSAVVVPNFLEQFIQVVVGKILFPPLLVVKMLARHKCKETQRVYRS
jgi:hypothetical protein